MATPTVKGANTPAHPSEDGIQTGTPARAEKPMTADRHLWCDVYTGTMPQLIANGIVKAGQFPGGPDRPKHTCSFDACGELIPRASRIACVLRIQRYSVDKFSVRVLASDEERARREAAAKAASEAREKAQAVRAELDKALADLTEMPTTEGAFVKDAAGLFWMGWQFFATTHMSGNRHKSGFRFTLEFRDRFEALAGELYWEIRHAETTFDDSHRQARVRAARATLAKADRPLQRVIEKAVSVAMVETKRETRSDVQRVVPGYGIEGYSPRAKG